MKAGDLRVRRTKRLIMDAFLKLLKEKGYENITITDIAHCAGINRKTFYLHYESKSMLYKEIIIKLIGDFDMNLSNPDRHRVKNINIQILQKEIEGILTSIARNRELVLILLKDPTTDYFAVQLTYILTRDFFSLLSRRANNHAMYRAVPTPVIADSLTAYMMVWIKWAVEQESLQIEETAHIICSLVQGLVSNID